MYNNTVLGRLFHLCDDDCALVTVLLVELGELLERVVAGDVGVENEEGRVVLAQDVLGELEGTGGTEGLGLNRECDGDVVLLLVLRKGLVGCSGAPWQRYTDGLERLGHDLWAVVDSEDNICDTGSGKSLDLVLDHGLVGELNKRLWEGEGLQLASVRLLPVASRGSRASGPLFLGGREAYERPETGSKTSDKNDGCMAISYITIARQLGVLTFHIGGVECSGCVQEIGTGGLETAKNVFNTE